jgi:alpha-glucosidase
MPAPLLFTAPQFNTWIELLYDQRQERILAYAHALIARGYPPGVLMIDDNWQEDYGTWRFSARRFPDPKGMMRELHALGFKVMVWVCPFVSADSENYRLLQKQGLLLLEKSAGASSDSPASSARPAIIRWWNGASAVLDLSNPATRAWFKNELDSLMKEWGVDGFKFDAGDSVFYEPGQPGIEFVSHAPRTPEGHTVDFAGIGLDYPFNEYRACWKLGGQALAQRLRDKDHTWDALRELIPGMITEGLMGYAFTCPDMIGGGLSSAFEDPAKFDPELVVRSAQVHALMPMMQFSVAPWRVLPPELSDLCLAAARLHVKFRPQILKLAERSAKSGEPIVRPLAWQWPHRDYETIRDQFMLGDDVMVAPVVTKGAQTRPVVFPPGKWLGDDGTVVEGPARREVATPLARLPYYTLQAPGTN